MALQISVPKMMSRERCIYLHADGCLDAPEDQGIPPSSEIDRSPSPSHRNYAVLKSSAAEYPGTDVIMAGTVHDLSPNFHDEHGRPTIDRGESTNLRLVLKSRGSHTVNTSPALPPGAGHPTFSSSANGQTYRRSRPQTSHQKAVDVNRKMRVEHILHQQLVELHRSIRRRKHRRGVSFGFTAMKRIHDLPDDYDTEDDRSGGPGGLVPNPGENEDYGEDALRQKKALDRVMRRLDRGDRGLVSNGLLKGRLKRKRKAPKLGLEDEQLQGAFGEATKAEDESSRRLMTREVKAASGRRQGEAGGAGNQAKQEESLDDLDLDLLGESRDEENGGDELEEDSGLDDTEGEGDDMSE